MVCLEDKTAADAVKALKDVLQAEITKGQPIQDAYDEAVHPEQDQGITPGAEQLRWDGFVKVAKEDLRDPPENWPTGDAMKMTIFNATP